MGIKSDTFGRVTLTGADAKKFENQMTYGRAKAAAVAGIKRGVTLSQKLQNTGRIVRTIKVVPAR